MKIIMVFLFLERVAVDDFTYVLSNKYNRYFILFDIYEISQGKK